MKNGERLCRSHDVSRRAPHGCVLILARRAVWSFRSGVRKCGGEAQRHTTGCVRVNRGAILMRHAPPCCLPRGPEGSLNYEPIVNPNPWLRSL